MKDIKKRLEYLRGELRAQRISQLELCELQALAPRIDPGDVELLEAAGVPEKDPAAVLMGRRGKGKPKVLSDAERQRRGERMRAFNKARAAARQPRDGGIGMSDNCGII